MYSIDKVPLEVGFIKGYGTTHVFLGDQPLQFRAY